MTDDITLHTFNNPLQQITLDAAQVCTTGFARHEHINGKNSLLCLESCACGKPSLLPLLFADPRSVTVVLSAPDENDPRSGQSPHPALDVHINLGDDVTHEPCFTFSTCGMCHLAFFEAVLANAGGQFTAHLDPSNPDQANFTHFRIGDWKTTRAAVASVKERYQAEA